MSNEEVALSFAEGGSDKIYQAQLTEVAEGFTVKFQYGRRGKPLRDGTKTESPVAYDKAKKIYDKLVLSKTSKGYTPIESNVTVARTDKAGEITDFQPQLLNSISMEDLETISSKFPSVLLQVKHDGERRGVRITASDIEASNRKSLRVVIQQLIQDALLTLKENGYVDTVIDAEDMGDHLVAFDVLKFKGKDLKGVNFIERAKHLEELKEEIKRKNLDDAIKVENPTVADSYEQIKNFIESARANNEEGVVIKNGLATYNIGRPSSGGNALKLKFVESATVRVASISNGKRSVSLEIKEKDKWKEVGKCTIPSNKEIPNTGDLIEVDYLYAIKNGALFQPIYKGKRLDLNEAAADISQLKYKKD